MTSTINSSTVDELGGLPVGVARKISVEEEGGICRMPVRYLQDACERLSPEDTLKQAVGYSSVRY